MIQTVNNSRGSALVMALIAGAIGTIIVLGFATMFDNAQKAQNGVKFRADADNLNEEFRAHLSSVAACTNSFGGLVADASASHAITVLKDGSAAPGVARYSVGNTYGDRSVVLNSMLFANYVAGPVPNKAVMTLTSTMATAKVSAGTQVAPRSVQVSVETDAAKKITSCIALSKMSDGIWQRSATNLNNIYYMSPAGNGNVGIGTIDPYTALDVNGSMQISGPNAGFAVLTSGNKIANAGSNGWFLRGNADTGAYNGNANSFGLEYWNGVTPLNAVTFSSNGNVGIGTTSPGYKLQVNGGNVYVGQSGADAVYVAGSGAANEALTLGWSPAGFGYIQGGSWGGTTKSLILQGGGGAIGVGTGAPTRTLDVRGNFAVYHGNSSVSFSDEAGASVLRLKTNNGGGVTAYSLANGGQEFQLRVNSDNSLSLGHYTAPGALQGFAIRPNATVNGNTYTGTVFEFGQGGGGALARVIGSSGGAVFQGLGGGGTLVGNWDGGSVDLYSASRTGVTAGSGGVRVGSFGGEVELLASGAVRLNSASGQILANGATVQTSDVRLKKNILPLEAALEKVLNLRGVSYDWKDEAKAKGSGHQIGLIAQEVEKVYPEVVVTDSKTGLKSVAYDHLVAPLIEAVKALNHRIVEILKTLQSQSKEIESLKAENAQLKARLEKLEKSLTDKK